MLAKGYIGCFVDGWQRDLPNLLLDQVPNMTAQMCQSTCAKNGYKYAGLQAGYDLHLIFQSIFLIKIYVYKFDTDGHVYVAIHTEA